jgi:hypothetical protein
MLISAGVGGGAVCLPSRFLDYSLQRLSGRAGLGVSSDRLAGRFVLESGKVFPIRRQCIEFAFYPSTTSHVIRLGSICPCHPAPAWPDFDVMTVKWPVCRADLHWVRSVRHVLSHATATRGRITMPARSGNALQEIGL